ncbi:hypothetical protein EDD61_10917 [Longicatena caecimuris]|uniref:Uncharacterized protein n=1 Tax=Longicatena caecimuris TaxID=1796635 RepID=A0A4R3TEJ6_9FIRM|nr:hypothetical protein EDD61_10917 [Longicatena caecimuris]
MVKSIMQTDKECYITHSRINLHKHHIFYGTANRKKSEKWGCWVYLTAEYHNMSDYGVHFDKDLDLRLKRECQERFEALYGHDMFMMVFHRNYL